VMRAKVGFEEVDGRECIIVTWNSIPSQQSRYDQAYRRFVNDKKIDGIANIQMNRSNGMRIVYLKRDATPNVVLNTLYKFTQLQSSFLV
jgi:DNA gyrase subunit A